MPVTLGRTLAEGRPLSIDHPTPIDRLGVTAFDCPDAMVLTTFYCSIIAGDVVPGEDGDWVELHTPTGNLAFQEITDHPRPTWPGGEVPQQGHTDIDVADLDAAEQAVLRLGAEKAGTQPRPDRFRAMIDPAGHSLLPGARLLTKSPMSCGATCAANSALAEAERVAVGGEAFVVSERQHRGCHACER
jgi:hypothetical protein